MNNPLFTHNQIEEMLPAYVLGALDPEEMVAVDDYLNEQRALLRRLEGLEETAAKLAQSAPHVPLPSDARTRLMARVRADTAGAPYNLAPSAPRPVTTPPAPHAHAPTATRNPLGTWLSGLNLGWAMGGALALLLLVALYTVRLNGQISGLEARLDQSQTQIAELEQTADTLQNQNSTLLRQLQDQQASLAVLAETNQTFALAGTEEAPGAGGTLYAREGQGVLILHGLSPLPEDQSYQLWLLGDADPVPSDLLTIPDESARSVVVTLPLAPGEFAGAAVSVEPSNGSPAPTGPIVLAPPSP